MWTTVAKRCRGLDMIAGYEIMSEPRVQNTAPEVVRDFYRAGCAAAHSGDPRTPCIVGAAPFYNVRGLEGALMADVPNAIYAFNFFIPRKYVNGDAVLKYKYPGPMRCCDAHEKEHARCCPGKEDQDMAQLPCCAAQVQVDKRLLEQELAVALDFRERHQVPVFMDQWAISRTSGRDRLLYVKDVLALLQAHRVHWAYWQWRQRDYSQMAVVTMNEDWDDPWFDEALVDVFRTVLGPDAYVTYRDPPPPPRAHSPPPSRFLGLPPAMASPRLIDSTPIELPSPRPPSTASPRPVDSATAELAAPSPPSVEPPRLISSTSVALASFWPSVFPNSPPGYPPNSGPFEGQRLSVESDTRQVVTRVTLRAAPSSSPSESESSVLLSLPPDRHDRSSLVAMLELGPYSLLALLFMCLMCALAFGYSRKALVRRRHCIATSRCVRPRKARTQYARIAAQAP